MTELTFLGELTLYDNPHVFILQKVTFSTFIKPLSWSRCTGTASPTMHLTWKRLHLHCPQCLMLRGFGFTLESASQTV